MQRARGFMDIELYRKVVNELRPYLFNINLYLQGEPMLHPRFFSFIESSYGFNTIVSTNGHFLSRENSERLVNSGLSKLIISVDGADQETYESYRKNGNLQKVIGGIDNICKAKTSISSKLNIEIQFLVNRLNEHQIPQMKELAGKKGVNLKLKSMQIIEKEKH